MPPRRGQEMTVTRSPRADPVQRTSGDGTPNPNNTPQRTATRPPDEPPRPSSGLTYGETPLTRRAPSEMTSKEASEDPRYRTTQAPVRCATGRAVAVPPMPQVSSRRAPGVGRRTPNLGRSRQQADDLRSCHLCVAKPAVGDSRTAGFRTLSAIWDRHPSPYVPYCSGLNATDVEWICATRGAVVWSTGPTWKSAHHPGAVRSIATSLRLVRFREPAGSRTRRSS